MVSLISYPYIHFDRYLPYSKGWGGQAHLVFTYSADSGVYLPSGWVLYSCSAITDYRPTLAYLIYVCQNELPSFTGKRVSGPFLQFISNVTQLQPATAYSASTVASIFPI